MTTSSNGNIFRITGPLCGEFTGHRWIPPTKASDAELWYFLRLNKRLSKQSRRRWFDSPLGSLWRNCNVFSGEFVWMQVFRHAGNILCYTGCLIHASRSALICVPIMIDEVKFLCVSYCHVLTNFMFTLWSVFIMATSIYITTHSSLPT